MNPVMRPDSSEEEDKISVNDCITPDLICVSTMSDVESRMSGCLSEVESVDVESVESDDAAWETALPAPPSFTCVVQTGRKWLEMSDPKCDLWTPLTTGIPHDTSSLTQSGTLGLNIRRSQSPWSRSRDPEPGMLGFVNQTPSRESLSSVMNTSRVWVDESR